MKVETKDLIFRCLDKRQNLLELKQSECIRLFNGFYEGISDLVIDMYKKALVLNFHGSSGNPEKIAQDIYPLFIEKFPWIESVLLKARQSTPELVNGKLIMGKILPKMIVENGVKYALDLQLNQDNSFYPDTRNLRTWLKETMQGKSVLNTFAYTGSLGVAALTGGAAKVVQTDNKERFLELAKESARLNQISVKKCVHITMDFFKMVDRFKTSETLFDCVILDAPYFSTTTAGRVDLVNDYARLVNKIRPLVAHQGWLVLVNNALFVSGKEMMSEIDKLCKTSYYEVSTLVPIPEDVAGYPATVVNKPPTDPAPFNHPTKIAILKTRRKDGRPANF